jgi:chromosome segregation ATPase
MKHDERRNVHDGVDDSVLGERGHVQKGPFTSMVHHSQETVQALTDALLELQMELRERCHECEVLRATVEALSSELRTSDSSLEEAQLQAERLDFRLQAVSYSSQSDLAANEETERMALSGKRSKKDKKLLAADKESKKSKKKSKTSKNETSERKCKVEKKKDKKHKTFRSRAEREPPAEAECRDDINSQPRPEAKAEPELGVEAGPLVISVSPRQAAF